ncbi:MAG: gliding motility protein [Polyangiales bacterium]
MSPEVSANVSLEELPDVDALGARYTPEKPRSKVTRTLHAVLSDLDPSASHEAKLAWIESFGVWLHASTWVGQTPREGREDSRTFRLRMFIRVLTDHRAARRRFAEVVSTVLAQMHVQQLFSDVGLPMEPGFARETIDRISRALLPAPPNPYRMAELLPRLFSDVDDAAWLDILPRELLVDFGGLLHEASDASEAASRTMREGLGDAIAIIAARVCALGLAQDIRDRLPDRPVKTLPFLRLPRVCDALQGSNPSAMLLKSEHVRSTIVACRSSLAEVIKHGEEYGVSVDLVYRVELMSAQLGRLEDLLAQYVPGFFQDSSVDTGHLLAALIRGHYQGQGLRALFRRSFDMLARKIIERTGVSGEHYITRTRKEWRQMFVSASGGGVLTCGTTAIKYLIAAVKLPAFFAGVFASINYAGSFLLMQALGFTLATKQPAMTAAALAAALEAQTRRGRSHTKIRRLDRLVDVIARITRSQLAAAMGNVLMVIPTALGFDYLWKLATGNHFLGVEKANHVVESLHVSPLRSPTILFAALTGVILWCSSIVAGWVENWAVYRRLPEAITHSRQLVYVFGRARAEWMGKKFAHGISGFGGNVSLGIMLGTIAPFASFFGLPLDVRHVTLSTGALALSAATLGYHKALYIEFIWAMVGIVVIGILNFGVSFACACFVAFRAREIHRNDIRVLVKTLLSRLWKQPFSFVFPPKSENTSDPYEASHGH